MLLLPLCAFLPDPTSGTVGSGGNPLDIVYVSIDGEKYAVNSECGRNLHRDRHPVGGCATGETIRTYRGTIKEGGISEIQSGLIISLNTYPLVSGVMCRKAVVKIEQGIAKAEVQGRSRQLFSESVL